MQPDICDYTRKVYIHIFSNHSIVNWLGVAWVRPNLIGWMLDVCCWRWIDLCIHICLLIILAPFWMNFLASNFRLALRWVQPLQLHLMRRRSSGLTNHQKNVNKKRPKKWFNRSKISYDLNKSQKNKQVCVCETTWDPLWTRKGWKRLLGGQVFTSP